MEKEEWCVAMSEEIRAIEKNNIWTLVDLSEGKEAIGLKWIYKSKLNSNGSWQRNKAQLVAKGYAQIPGIDFTETYALVARFDTVRIILAFAAYNGWIVHQLDIKSTFLNGELLQNVYVEQPEGFIIKG